MTSTTTDFISTLTATASAYQNNHKLPGAEEVVSALLAAEKAAKQQRLNYPFDALLGDWRLCFATGTKKVRERGGIILGKGFYVPKLAKIQISFHSLGMEKGEVSNQVKLGFIDLQLTGPAKYPGKKNLLAFDFTQMEISLFSRVIYNQKIRSGQNPNEDFYHQTIAKQAFFAFFLVTDSLIAARGRGGGLAIWVRAN